MLRMTRPDRVVTPERGPSRLPVSVIALIAAVGVLIASAADTAARLGYSNSPWANRVYWLGQALILIPIAARLLSRRRLTDGAAVTLLVVLTVAEYILKICYSPLQFTFADELLHWRGTENLLQTGNPFTPNYGLSIAPHYPGLELATSALISMTGLSIFTAGAIVSGAAHLLSICALYLIFRTVARSHRLAGIAVLVYYATPDLTSFNSMFVYENLAFAFLGLAVLASVKSVTEEGRQDQIRWFIIAVVSIIATVMTHHITSYVLTLTLILVAVAGKLTHSGHAARVSALAIISIVTVVCWITFVAPDTLTYFKPTLQGMVQGVNSLAGGRSSGAPSTARSPMGDQFLEGLALLITAILLVFGTWQVWRRFRRQPWIPAMTIGSLSWFLALGIRIGVPDGQELAGRMMPFVDIPVSLIVVFAIVKLVSAATPRRWATGAVAALATAVLLLVLDGLANGWPPYWERLPGPHEVSAFERSIGPEEVNTGNWTLSALGPGNRFASDGGISAVLAGYGNQVPLENVAYLYTTPKLTPSIVLNAKAQDVQYILIDLRLSQSLSPTGEYFPGDSVAYTKPLPLNDLAKYNGIPGVSRLYDSGDIIIYDLQRIQYEP